MHPHILTIVSLGIFRFNFYFLLRAPFYYQIKELGVRINKLKSDDDKVYIFFYVTRNIKEHRKEKKKKKTSAK